MFIKTLNLETVICYLNPILVAKILTEKVFYVEQCFLVG